MSAFKSACRPALFIFCVVQLASCGDGSGTTSAITPKISVDQKIVAQEVECVKQYAAVSTNNYVNYAAAIGAPEHTDSIHSGVQPCATFTGSFSGSNQATQLKSASTWSSIQFIVMALTLTTPYQFRWMPFSILQCHAYVPYAQIHA